MNFFDIYPLVLAILFVFLIGWLIPKAGKTYDLMKLHLDLFPNWFKIASGVWALATVCLTALFLKSAEGVEYFLVANLNFSMFLLLFSKEKQEDEFSEQLRLKAFFYAFISFVAFSILYGASKGSIFEPPGVFGEHLFVQFFLGVALATALVYFYFSIYKSSKKG